MEQGIFFPDLALGARAVSAGRQREIEEFLVAVVHKRACPLHLANLWNALYFNYDLAYTGFRADHLEARRIPTRTAAARDWSLPVGGFIRVHTEAACGDLLGEVVYKEGAHPDVNADWIAPLLSGAPATLTDEVAGERVAVVRERFVFDLAAFGPGANQVTAKQYERLCHKARWLDEQGHLVIDALYRGTEAELGDLDFYADYLLKEHRDGLLAFCFDEELSDEELREALLRSFEAVRVIAASSRQLRSWREEYFFSIADYGRRLSSEGALGEGDLRTIYSGLVRLPPGERRAYSALGPRLLEVLGRDGLEEEEEFLVRGCAYATAVCYASSFVAETLTREQSSGVLAGGIHLRLDDDWQAGGVWRAEAVDDPERYSLAAMSPILPLGLGYAESEEGKELAEEFVGDEQPIVSSLTGFRVALTSRDRALGRLRLPSSTLEVLAPGSVDVVIRHGATREAQAVEREGQHLYGVPWPWELHPGVILSCNVEAGGTVVRVRTVPVAPPLQACDGVHFDVETNVALYERELGLNRLAGSETRGATSLRELCNRAFQRRGHPLPGAARALTLAELATIVLGPAWRPSETRVLTQTIAAMGVERAGIQYVWCPRVNSLTRATDRTLLAAYGEAKPGGRIARSVRRHWVPMHLRRYTEVSGRAPSVSKRASYPQARRLHRMWNVLPEDLPRDCTWVEPYAWGEAGTDQAMASEPEIPMLWDVDDIE